MSEVFDEVKKHIKDFKAEEEQLKTEIKIKQTRLDEIQQKKMQLILLIANKELYEEIFGKIEVDKNGKN